MYHFLHRSFPQKPAGVQCFLRISTEPIKLEKNPFESQIIHRISNCFNRSSNERIPLFFDEIDLKVGSLENDAIRCRNTMIHSTLNLSGSDYEKIIRLSYAYQTLMHRILLRLLEYSGSYIGYATPSMPNNPLEKYVGEK